MKSRLILGVTLGVLVIQPVVHAAWTAMNHWKCTVCGSEIRKANENPPTKYGCKKSGDGCHIWMKITW